MNGFYFFFFLQTYIPQRTFTFKQLNTEITSAKEPKHGYTDETNFCAKLF